MKLLKTYYQFFSAYCTGRDGSILGAWQVVASEMAGMNCSKYLLCNSKVRKGKESIEVGASHDAPLTCD